jgi:fatty-acyl-CoA synthase
MGTMPEATAAAVDAEGWLHSGDLGTVDENGYFKITGRIKDMIIRGGENVYPREIEEFLLAMSGVKDVQVAGVGSGKKKLVVVGAVQMRQEGEKVLQVGKAAVGRRREAENGDIH